MGSINWDKYIKYNSELHRYILDMDGMIKDDVHDKNMQHMLSYLETKVRFKNRELEKVRDQKAKTIQDKHTKKRFKRIRKYVRICEKHSNDRSLTDDQIFYIIDFMEKLRLARDKASLEYKSTMTILHLYMKNHNREFDRSQLSCELSNLIDKYGICPEQVEIWYLMTHEREKKYVYDYSNNEENS